MSLISYVVALEFAIFLGYDGQLEQNSDLEIELFTSQISSIGRTQYIIRYSHVEKNLTYYLIYL